MLAIIKKQLLTRRMRQLISAALDALYSEQRNMSEVVDSLSAGKDGSALVRTYISMCIATRLTEPLTDKDVRDAVEQLLAAENHLNQEDFETILDLYKEMSELHWLHKHAAILRGKLAHKNDERSYEGTIYALQRDSKQPATLEQRAKFKEICGKMAELDRQIEERELKIWNEQDAEEYQRMKDELDIRSLQHEVDEHEVAEANRELNALTAMLEQKLKRTLNS